MTNFTREKDFMKDILKPTTKNWKYQIRTESKTNRVRIADQKCYRFCLLIGSASSMICRSAATPNPDVWRSSSDQQHTTGYEPAVQQQKLLVVQSKRPKKSSCDALATRFGQQDLPVVRLQSLQTARLHASAVLMMTSKDGRV